MDLYKARRSNRKSDSSSKKPRFARDSLDKKPRNSFRNSNQKDSRSKPYHEMHEVTCSDCGIDCKIPFEPKFNKPVYCSRCFEKNNPQKSKNSKFFRDTELKNKKSKNDRNSRLSYDEHRSKKSDNMRFQRKQEQFYSNGSEKFYASLKEKLFEILGGKICSSCGFRDERALGFANIYDGDAFDRIRRGGFASAWGKYISEPELARKELRVLCLNCNEIQEPRSRPEPQLKKQKKSRYFPR